MSQVVQFLPKSNKTARENMGAFIAYCRRLATFGADLEWDSFGWEVADYFDIRGMGGRSVTLNFTEFALRPSVSGPRMEAPFCDQVKAYIRYNAAVQERRYPPHRDIQAFRALYVAQRENGRPDLCSLDGHELDRAVQILLGRVAETSAMQAAERLQKISLFLAEKRLSTSAPRNWKHGIRVTPSLFGRVGPEFEARRQQKLPTQELLDSLAAAFNVAVRPRELIETSVYAILCSAPDRLNEVMCLPEDCEVPAEWERSQAYGLSWRGSKGYGDHIKWIPEPMVDVVRLAVNRLRESTQQAREIAKWYEARPGHLYLPPHLEAFRKEDVLSTADIYEIIGVGHTGAWARRNGLIPISGKVEGRGKNAALYSFQDVERAIIGMLPRSFPYFDKRTRLKYSEALLVVPYGLFNERWTTWSCMIQPVRHDQIAQALTGIKTPSGESPSLFQRLGMAPPSTTTRRATTHQFRHWLDTLALKGGLSDWDMAQWSGRKDVRQNRAYDHESSEEILAKLRVAIDDRDRSKGVTIPVPRNFPVSRDEFAKLEIPNAHSTEVGFCIHDFASSPCQLFMSCINCRELVCVKGDAFRTRRVEKMLGDTRSSLMNAKRMGMDEWEGAEDWIRAHTTTLERYEQLHAILTSPDIPDGTVVRMDGAGRYTAMEQAIRDRLGGETLGALAKGVERTLPDGQV
jgi:hypothetical protein